MDNGPEYGYLAMESGKEPERIFYEVHGKGTPVLFVNSPFLDRRMWESQVSELPDHGIQTITFDFRGTGKSDFPRVRHSRVEDMKKLMEHIGVERVIIVCSLGGCESALRFMNRFPDSVSAVVLSNPLIGAGRNLNESSDPRLVGLQGKQREVETLMKSGKFRDAVALNVSIWGEDMDESCRERLYEISIDNYRTLRAEFKNLLKEGEEVPRENEHPEIRKMILLGGKAIPPVTGMAERIKQGSENIKMVRVEESRQFPNMEQPSAFNGEILKFATES